MGDCWNCTKLYQIMQSWLVCHGHEVINMNISIYNGRDQWAAEGGLRKIFTTNIWIRALTLSTVADNVLVTIGHTAETPGWGDPVGPQTGDCKTETKTINPPTAATPPLQGYPLPPTGQACRGQEAASSSCSCSTMDIRFLHTIWSIFMEMRLKNSILGP